MRLKVVVLVPLVLGDVENPSERVAGILRAADPFWFPRPTEDYTTDLSPEDIEECRVMIRDVKKESSDRGEKSHVSGSYTHSWNVLLNETPGPELYQIFTLRFMSKEFRRPPDVVIVKAAFTMKMRDAKGGILDFNSLKNNGKEFILSGGNDGLSLSPFPVDKKLFETEGKSVKDKIVYDQFFLTEIVNSANKFFQKYFSVEEFSMIALRVTTICKLSRLVEDNFQDFIESDIDPACASSTTRFIPKHAL